MWKAISLRIIDIVPLQMPNNIEEVFVKVKGYAGYEVSNLGNIRSVYTGKIMKAHTVRGEYLQIGLTQNGKQKNFMVHRLVAEAFLPNPENKPCVDHIDTIRTNNVVTNLRWVTHKENSNNELSRKHYSDAKTEWWKDESRREWMSESKKGEKNPNWGKKFSQEYIEKIIQHRRKKVYQYTIDGVLVAEYESCNEATRINGFSTGNLSRACRNGGIRYGYRWSYDRV